MWILISAVITASLLGSMHCVGMCGPLAIWASGMGQRYSRPQVIAASSLYHFGRLLTYALVGWLAGFAGQLTDFGGEALGLQLAAAKVVGTLMIVIGILQLSRLLGLSSSRMIAKPQRPSRMSALLVSLRPYVFSLPIGARALVTGLLTALLPCGWLYLFALAAAGTGSQIMGSMVMVAFWVGTVPALVGLIATTHVLASRLRTSLPIVAATLLIVGGGYTAAGRGFANLKSLADIRPVANGSTAKLTTSRSASQLQLQANCEAVASEIDELTKTPLPCCIGEKNDTSQ